VNDHTHAPQILSRVMALAPKQNLPVRAL
jgi:hypothetical protein